jgi:CBS domain-containing protein
MATQVITVPASLSVKELLENYFLAQKAPRHQAYPVLDEKGDLVGVVTRANLLEDWVAASIRGDGAALIEKYPIIVYDLVSREPITVFPWESCRTAAERMAEAGIGRLPVVSPTNPNKVVGMVTRSDLLKSRARHVEEEVRRERFLGLRSLFMGRKQ